MMLSSRLGWLVPVALTVVGFGSNVQSAAAQTTYNFDVKYNTLLQFVPRPDLGQDIIRATITGESADANFGLTNFESNTYGKLVEATATTQKFKFNADPAVFGLKDLPILGDRYFGGSNELFGKADDMATINFANNTVMGGGTINIIGGKGIFENASGAITFTQQDRLDPTAPPGTPVKGEAVLKFSLQTPQKVPEPTATTTLVGMGVIGAGLLVRRRRYKTTLGAAQPPSRPVRS
ncbi:MAG: hypothetical protein ACHBN1_08955 [Heteroscytonema crispum UTEX LB 1556]